MSDTVLSETTAAVKKPRKYTKPTQRRVGPACPTCGHAQSVADVPKSEEQIAKAREKLAKLTAALAKVDAGITVKALAPAVPTTPTE